MRAGFLSHFIFFFSLFVLFVWAFLSMLVRIPGFLLWEKTLKIPTSFSISFSFFIII